MNEARFQTNDTCSATAEGDGRNLRSRLIGAWSAERVAAAESRSRVDAREEWRHLERAHVLSQSMAGPHLRTHLSMLAVAWRRHDAREVVGQLLRVVLAAPGSWTGRYPTGNTGGSDVSAFRVMPIPTDLQPFLEVPDRGETA